MQNTIKIKYHNYKAGDYKEKFTTQPAYITRIKNDCLHFSIFAEVVEFFYKRYFWLNDEVSLLLMWSTNTSGVGYARGGQAIVCHAMKLWRERSG